MTEINLLFHSWIKFIIVDVKDDNVVYDSEIYIVALDIEE